jgi:hypothetical protein
MSFSSLKTAETKSCATSTSRSAVLTHLRGYGRKAMFGVFALGLAHASSRAQGLSESHESQLLQPPAILTPTDGSTRFLTAHAVGTQDYICLESPDTQTPTWVFYGPQATLSVPLFGVAEQQVITHFLSPVSNATLSPLPACTLSLETQELNCPSWQSSFDSSAVWGETAASIPAGSDPSCPTAGSLPCLLVEAVATKKGTFGPGYLTNTTYIQRLNTVGGAAPSGSCKVGDQALVPYSADYSFYEKVPTDKNDKK